MLTTKNKESLFKAVQKFVSKYIDTKTYTAEEWKAKEGEMAFGDVVFIAEGELYHLLNNSRSKKEWNALHKIAEKHGCYIEQGFHWSWHFCDKENLLK
jgi:hypothetical protein